MRKLIHKYAVFAVVAAVALFWMGCDNSAGGDETTTPAGNPVLDAVLEYLDETERFDVYTAYTPDMWGNPGFTPGAAGLVTGDNTDLVAGLTINGEFKYFAKGSVEPYVLYKLRAVDSATLDPHLFSSSDAASITNVIKSKLGSYGIDYRNADYAAGYVYISSVTGAALGFPDDGVIGITFNVVTDTVADGINAAINAAGAITAVDITGGVVAITGSLSATPASYASGTKTLTVTIPAAGITEGGAHAVALALLSTLNGILPSIMNDDDAIVPASASAAISGGDVVVSIVLKYASIPAATISAVIDAVGNGNLDISSGGAVTSDVITALAPITGATDAVTAAYDSTAHTVTITVTPETGVVFSTADDAYDLVADGQDAFIGPLPPPVYWGLNPEIKGLKRQFNGATITNGVDADYAMVTDVTYTVSGGNLVFTVSLGDYITAATIIGGLSGVANDSGVTITGTAVTGDVITALPNITGGTSTVTAVYSSTYHSFTITVEPAAGLGFNPGIVVSGGNATSPYAALAATVAQKIGVTVTNNTDATYTMRGDVVVTFPAATNLVITVFLGVPIADGPLVSAITGGTVQAVFNPDFSVSVVGTVITALNGLSVTGAVTATSAFNWGTYTMDPIVITIPPGAGGLFDPTPGAYNSVEVALSAATITNWAGPVFVNTITAVVSGGNLVLTVTPY